MAIIADGIPASLPRPYLKVGLADLNAFADWRLTAVFESARRIPFDDASRIVFLSDCHRGDNSRVDSFARNEPLYLQVLAHYYREGFTYVEVGDGDELWQNRRFSDIQSAHGRVFDLFHQFDRQGRLHLILGNHDIPGSRHARVMKAGIPTCGGLVLQHTRTGQSVFAVHGHQADVMSEQFCAMSRFLVRYVWKYLRTVGLGDAEDRAKSIRERAAAGRGSRLANWLQVQEIEIEQGLIGPSQAAIEQRIVRWVESHSQVTICGHTHLHKFATCGAPPYFNAGSCTYPDYLTGIEIQGGDIMAVKWFARDGAGHSGTTRIERELMAPSRRLRLLN